MKSRFTRLTLRAGRRLGVGRARRRRRRRGSGARAPLDDGVINACRHKSGYLLVPSPGKTCKKSEQALSWNVKGRRVPSGPPVRRARPAGRDRRAAAGPAGPLGPAGPPGPAAGSTRSTRSTASPAPRRRRRGNGAVETEVDGAIVLTCEDGAPPTAASACLPAARARASTRSTTTRSARTRRLRRDLQRRHSAADLERASRSSSSTAATGIEYLPRVADAARSRRARTSSSRPRRRTALRTASR